MPGPGDDASRGASPGRSTRVRVAARRVGDARCRSGGSRTRSSVVDVHRDRAGAELRVQLLPDRERRADDRDVEVRRAERAGDRVGAARLALVEDRRPPTAPAVCAFSALSWNVQVPRWISAIVARRRSRRSRPPRSPRSTSSASGPAGTGCRSPPGRCAVDVAAARVGHRRELVVRHVNVRGSARPALERRGRGLLEEREVERLHLRVVARRRELADDVVDRCVEARRARTRACRRWRSRCSGTPARASSSPGR